MTLYARRGKRFLDLTAAVVLLGLTAPVHGLCAAAIRLTAGPPVYFLQERSGLDGKPFRLLKFRTMVVGTHERSGGYPTAAMVTPVGRIMRKTSLDELPQLVNIARGQMSFVGPRPALPDQVARYTEHQRRRLTVLPGLTGLAQVRYRNNAPWSVRIESDIEYVDNVSPWRDLSIAARTVPAAVLGLGVAHGQTATDVDDLSPARPDSVTDGHD